ncbi:MAG: T9SS type A sorting domain-containing protein [Saprospiraceae bacterium]|nr:T9SS type A sorting domain-containing protein [Saprospiraceae bacterium]
MKIKLIAILCFSFMWSLLQASIYCPSDKTLYCNDDIHYLYLTGTATTIGYPPSIVKYKDISYLNQCNTGYIDRIWYIDINQDGQYQSSEASCTQKLTLVYILSDILVSFPANKEYTCKDDITKEFPTWITGPCDVLGVHVDEEIYEVSPDACYKIFRKFTVINWCTYKPHDPAWDGSGIWLHTQIIKVAEKTPPVISDCANKIIGVEGDCKAPFILKNSAADDVVCASELLVWQVEIDLWANGTIDYRYGINEPAPYKLNAAKNGEEITITLPERVGVGKHKVFWSVHDQCGNFKTCNMTVETKDLKKPTPYMYALLTTAFQGNIMNLTIPAKCFNVGSFDNCTPASKLRYSFSPNVNDTIRIISCNNAGFQFYHIYVTDLQGNQEFVEVFLLAFDNESCQLTGNFTGMVAQSNGKPLPGVGLSLESQHQPTENEMSDQTGTFGWENVSLFDDYTIQPNYTEKEPGRVDIADLKKLQNYIMGLDVMVNFEYAAADLNGDHKIRINDLKVLKSMILNPDAGQSDYWRFIVDTDTIIHITDLSLCTNVLDIMKFDGHIDFKAVYKGDITGANAEQTSPRHTMSVIQETEQYEYRLIAESVLSSEGVEFEFNISPDIIQGVSVASPYFKIPAQSVYKDYKNNKIRIVLLQNFKTEPGNPILFITSDITIQQDDITLGASSKLLLDKYQTAELRIKNLQSVLPEVNIAPNPSNGVFENIPVWAKVLSVVNHQGIEQVYEAHDGKLIVHAGSGMYFITFSINGGTVTKKVVIL